MKLHLLADGPQAYSHSYSHTNTAPSNVEASLFQLCYHTRKKQLKYCGQFAAQVWAVCRAAWINMTRIASDQAKQAEAAA